MLACPIKLCCVDIQEKHKHRFAMQTIKIIVLITASVSFILFAIAFCTPGWVLFNIDIPKMTTLQLKKEGPEALREYEEQMKRLKEMAPSTPDFTDMTTRIGPFYSQYCLGMTTNGNSLRMCPFLSSGNIISLLDLANKNSSKDAPIQQMVQKLKENGKDVSVTSVINLYEAVIVVSALFLVQSFISVVLCIIYVCIRYPKKKLGYAGGSSSIISGVLGLVLGIVFVAVYSDMKSIMNKDMEDSVEYDFPYSVFICFLASVLFCVSGAILLRVTVKSKPQFNYELMVIGKDGGHDTYVAQT